jgi:hypothetical protein
LVAAGEKACSRSRMGAAELSSGHPLTPRFAAVLPSRSAAESPARRPPDRGRSAELAGQRQREENVARNRACGEKGETGTSPNRGAVAATCPSPAQRGTWCSGRTKRLSH